MSEIIATVKDWLEYLQALILLGVTISVPVVVVVLVVYAVVKIISG